MSRKTVYRLIILAIISVGLMLIGRHPAVSPYFTFETLQRSILDAGAFGVVLFVAVYAAGILMNIPGVIFLFTGFAIYGGFSGIAIGYLATTVSVMLHFAFVRTMAGKAFSEIRQPFIRRMMANMDDHPIRTTVLLRLVLFVSPPVNYALALSNVRWKHFVIGSLAAFPANIMFNYFLMTVARDQWVKWFM